jgi:uncharacterized protein (TIGR00369 family)
MKQMSSKTRERANTALGVPLLHFLGAELIDEADPAAGLTFVASDQTVNAVDYLHGGVISTVLDLAAWLAVVAELDDDEEAITHNLSVSYLTAVKGRAPLTATGTVVRRSKRLAFATAELRDDERLIATAQVTKSIVSGR